MRTCLTYPNHDPIVSLLLKVGRASPETHLIHLRQSRLLHLLQRADLARIGFPREVDGTVTSLADLIAKHDSSQHIAQRRAWEERSVSARRTYLSDNPKLLHLQLDPPLPQDDPLPPRVAPELLVVFLLGEL